MKRLFGLAVLVLAALTFTLSSCQNETKDDKPTAYTVTIANDITNGTVTANKTSAVKGDTVKLTATPDNGWQLSSYIVTDENGKDITVTEGIFTMPASNVTVSATFTKTAATLNQEAADAVIEKINAIGTVTYTTESKAKIDEARTAYDALTGAQKALVTNYGTLTAAESTYESLIPTYTVTYADGVDGEEITVPTDSAKYKAGDTVTVKFDGIGTRSCYEFAGWSDGTTTYTSNGTKTFTMGTANVTLTAQWKVTRALAVGKIGVYEKPYFVGDIVFTDGSATPYTAGMTITDEQKAAAIALIFYSGTGLNSGDDTTTSRTLGVGLKNNRSELAWCTKSANAYSNNITTIQCDPDTGGSAGNYTWTGSQDRNGSDNLGQIAAFLSAEGSGTTDDTATEANYPAFYFAKNYKDTAKNIAGTDYESGWYLPSIAELFQIYACFANSFNVYTARQALGGDQFGTSYYWSSSLSASDDNYVFIFSLIHREWGYASKTANYSVCAIRAFN